MQIAAAAPLPRIRPGPAGTSGTAPSGAADGAPAPPAVAARPRLASTDAIVQRDPALQGDSADAQQALAFLDLCHDQLQGLKSGLAAGLAGRPGRDGQIALLVRQFDATWRSRATAAGATLDDQLGYQPGASAMQRFTVHGLDLAALRRGAAQVVTLAVGGAAPLLSAVALQPGLDDSVIAARFARALAPAGISVAVSAGAVPGLLLSTPEAAWPAVRDTLAMGGDGIRFPTGQMRRATAVPAAAVIAPGTWHAGDIGATGAAARATLKHVIDALARVRQARASVSAALADIQRRTDATQSPLSPSSAGQLASQFASAGRSAAYAPLLAVHSALDGISRARVCAVLALA